MKTMDNTKKVVLGIGALVTIFALTGLANGSSLMVQFLPLYSGLTLMGCVLLHKERVVESNVAKP